MAGLLAVRCHVRDSASVSVAARWTSGSGHSRREQEPMTLGSCAISCYRVCAFMRPCASTVAGDRLADTLAEPFLVLDCSVCPPCSAVPLAWAQPPSLPACAWIRPCASFPCLCLQTPAMALHHLLNNQPSHLPLPGFYVRAPLSTWGKLPSLPRKLRLLGRSTTAVFQGHTVWGPQCHSHL